MDGRRPQLKEQFAEAVRKRRKAMGFSQEAFADHLGMHRSYYGAIERGVKDIQLTTIARICRGLKAKPSELFKDAGF
jgi:transcriptional regulator with XRE-family HTH domain